MPPVLMVYCGLKSEVGSKKSEVRGKKRRGNCLMYF